MSQSARLQFIIRCLNHRGGVTLREIADAFEVSTRQAGRDIEYLRDQMHAPVVYDWKSRRYHLESIWESYTNTDERMIIMGAYLKSLFAKIKLGKYFEDEIMTSLYSGISAEVKRVLDRVEYRGQSVDIPNWTILSTVIDAFASGSCLVIRYTSLRDEVSERTIEPGRLINYNNTWYVVAYDYKRDDIRTFHLSRIQEARVADMRMTHDVGDLKGGYGIFLSDHLEEYRIRFTGAAARIVSTQVWSDDQRQERQEDGSLILTLKSSSLEELVPAVLSFGAEAQPLSPQSFVNEYRRRLHSLFEREHMSEVSD